MIEHETPRSFKSSLINLRENTMLLCLAGVLVLMMFVFTSSNRTGKEIAVTSITILLVKSESRSQPRSVIVCAFLLCALATLAVINQGELGRVCSWIGVAGMIPLIFSKWLFAQGRQVPHGRLVVRRQGAKSQFRRQQRNSPAEPSSTAYASSVAAEVVLD